MRFTGRRVLRKLENSLYCLACQTTSLDSEFFSKASFLRIFRRLLAPTEY